MSGRRVDSLGRVTRRSLGRAAACLATGLLTAVAALSVTPVAPAQADEDTTPLRVSIESLTPSALPVRGKVTVTGEITNTTSSTWRDLKVYLLTSQTPMTSAEDLASAARTDPSAQIGTRVTADGLYQKVGDLAPGQSVPYTLSVNRRVLGIGSAPGVYWLGVHVLARDPDGARDNVADGRARTFLPQVPARTPARKVALVVPVTEPVARDRDGKLLSTPGWRHTLGADGRLDRLVRLSESSPAGLTWLLDPAVLDAARSLVDGNPGLSVAPTDGTPDPAATASPSASASASPTPSDGASTGTSTSSGSSTASPGAEDAATWLQLLQRQVPQHSVLALPYGDLDVAAALDRKQGKVFASARDLSQQTLTAAHITARQVVAPASGLLPRDALRRLGPSSRVLLGSAAFPGSTDAVLSAPGGARVTVADAGASAGGPSPDDRWSALAVRQRVLAEAAVSAIAGGHPQPLVVRTPQHWDPGAAWAKSDFFGGLAVPWLHLVDLPAVTEAPSAPPATGAATYPRSESRAEVPFANLLATDELVRTGATFATLLTRNDTVDDQLARIAVLGSSTNVRRHPDAALARVRATSDRVRADMQEVHLEGPTFVTMSSAEGPVQITVVNDLNEEVTVRVKAVTSTSDVRIDSSPLVTLGPGKRASIRLSAHAKGVGVHAVQLVATDTSGTPLGSTTDFTVRTSQVGLVIWVIMAVGGAVLVIAIVLRTWRRISNYRKRRTTSGDPDDDTPVDAPQEEHA